MARGSGILPSADYNAGSIGSTHPMTRSTASPPPAPSEGTPLPVPSSYEAALGELETLVSAMESAALPLDRLLESYRRAAELLAFCRGRLAAVESQVKVLEDGQLKAWSPEG